MFEASTDQFVTEKVRENFAFLTGEARPTLKKPGTTHVDGNTIEDHFVGGSSFLHRVIFFGAFTEAKRRGILNAVEVAMCEEVIAILSEG